MPYITLLGSNAYHVNSRPCRNQTLSGLDLVLTYCFIPSENLMQVTEPSPLANAPCSSHLWPEIVGDLFLHVLQLSISSSRCLVQLSHTTTR